MEMLQLRYFFESAKNQSFKKTAEKYMVPQTSVSASVKRLEKELKKDLFERTSNRIILNENGKILFQALEEIFSKLDEAASMISASSDKRDIKMLVCAIRFAVTQKIIDYKATHPHTSFETSFDFDEMDFSDYDIIVDERSDKYSLYESIELFKANIKLYVSKDHHLYGKKLTLAELKNEPFICIGTNNSLTRCLTSTCKRVGFTPRFALKSNDLGCMKKCIDAGMGIGITRLSLGQKPKKDVCYLDVSDFCETQTICVYYKKSAAYGNVLDFLNFLTEENDYT